MTMLRWRPFSAGAPKREGPAFRTGMPLSRVSAGAPGHSRQVPAHPCGRGRERFDRSPVLAASQRRSHLHPNGMPPDVQRRSRENRAELIHSKTRSTLSQWTTWEQRSGQRGRPVLHCLGTRDLSRYIVLTSVFHAMSFFLALSLQLCGSASFVLSKHQNSTPSGNLLHQRIA